MKITLHCLTAMADEQIIHVTESKSKLNDLSSEWWLQLRTHLIIDDFTVT